MKKVLAVIILLTAAVAYAAVKPAVYAGKWTLDKAQSTNLPNFYDKVKSHRLEISQDEKVLSVAVEIVDDREKPAKFTHKYNLDGTEIKAEAQVRTPNGDLTIPATYKASESGDGKLQITITREFPAGENTVKAATVEDWQLSPDGKTLKIHRVDDTPRGKREFDLVFVKE